MADRDVILAALLRYRAKAPLYLRQLTPYEYGLLAEVAAQAVAEAPTAAGVRPVTMYAAVCGGCGKQWDSDDYMAYAEPEQAITAAQEYSGWQKDGGRILCHDCRLKPGGDLYEEDEEAPVGTPAEEQACAARSGIGLGEVG